MGADSYFYRPMSGRPSRRLFCLHPQRGRASTWCPWNLRKRGNLMNHSLILLLAALPVVFALCFLGALARYQTQASLPVQKRMSAFQWVCAGIGIFILLGIGFGTFQEIRKIYQIEPKKDFF